VDGRGLNQLELLSLKSTILKKKKKMDFNLLSLVFVFGLFTLYIAFSKNHYNSIFLALLSAVSFYIVGQGMLGGVVFHDFDSAGNFRSYELNMDVPSGPQRYARSSGLLFAYGSWVIFFASLVMHVIGWRDEKSPVALLNEKLGRGDI